MNNQSQAISGIVQRPRNVERLVVGQATSDGAGVKLTRVLGQALQRRLDPFLMLDAFGSDQADDYIKGFPDHPHRGFETITYMIEGRMRHRDSAGHEGLLESGGMQWMSAARGVIHSELPEQISGRMEGFQLWLNLPAKTKLGEPWYRDFAAAELPRLVTPDRVEVRIIAGHSHGLAGAITRPDTEPLILDLRLPANAHFQQLLPAMHNAFVYVYRGTVQIEDTEVSSQRMAILANFHAAGKPYPGRMKVEDPPIPSPALPVHRGGSKARSGCSSNLGDFHMNEPDSDGVRIEACGEARALLIAGRPLAEPIVQHGPFVMNTEQQIYQALNDFRNGQLA